MAVRFPKLSWRRASLWLHHSSFRFSVDARLIIHGSGNEREHIIVTVKPNTSGISTCAIRRQEWLTQSHLLLSKRDRQQVVLQTEATVRFSPFSPLLLVPDNGQPMRACQHFLDDKGIPHTWADWCPNPGLLCTCCVCHIIGGGAVHGEVEQLYRHPIPPPFRPRGAFQIIAASQFNMWHEMLVKTRGSLCKSVSLHFGKHLIVHFVFNDRDGHKSAKVLIRSRSCLDFDGSCSQRVELSLSNILIHATASHCRQCTGGHLRELLINNWLYINAASFSKVLSYCICGKKNVLAKVIISGSVF